MPEVIKGKVFDYLNTPHESVTLLYVSKYFREYFFNRNYKYFHLSSGFCSIKYWEKILRKNAFNLMQKIYSNYDLTYVFDLEKVYSEVVVTLRHLSLFVVCFHLSTCLRSCDKVTNYCSIVLV